MSDLETSAHEAVAQVQPLVAVLDEAQQESQQALQHVQALRNQLSADRQALHDAIAGMQKDAEVAESSLVAQLRATITNLGHLADAVGSAATDWEELFAQEEEALATGAALLKEMGAHVEEAAEKVGSASQGIFQWVDDAAKHLEEIVEALDHDLGTGLVATLVAWREQAGTAVGNVVTFLQKDCEDLLHHPEAEWNEKATQLPGLLAQTFERAAAHQKEVGQYLVDRWEQLLLQEIEAAHTSAAQVAEVVAGVGTVTQNCSGRLRVAAEMITQQQQEAAAGATQLSQALADTRARWATFGLS